MTITIDLIKDRIRTFLYSSENDCLAIRGKWGTGKTYIWKMIFSQSNACKMQFDNYSYVSLFGVNSIQQIKMAIVSNMIGKSKKNNQISFIKSVQNFTKKNISIINRLTRPLGRGVEEVASLINDAFFFNISNSLICFDDFERKDEKLTIHEVLGIISDLKEQKNCKIVLIFNEESLDDQEKHIYKQFREKIIDKELLFNPSPEDCAKIVFFEDDNNEKLAELTKQLKINNIRILSHIKKLAKNLLHILVDFPEEVKHSALHSLVLFTYAFYSNDPDLPEFNVLREINYSSFVSDENENSIPNWKNLLQIYGYRNTENFDLLIHDGVNHGYFDEPKLLEQANILAEQVNVNKSHEDIYKAWDLYRNDFNSNEGAIIDAFDKMVRKHYNNMFPDNLNSVITVLRTLSKNDLADTLIDFYIEKRKTEKHLFNLTSNFSIMPKNFPVDKILEEKFNKVFQSTIKKPSLKEVLECISKSNGWSKEDEMVYNAATVENLYKIFKTEDTENVYKLIRAGLLVVPAKTREALKIIGSESRLNALKVREFGIIVGQDKEK